MVKSQIEIEDKELIDIQEIEMLYGPDAFRSSRVFKEIVRTFLDAIPKYKGDALRAFDSGDSKAIEGFFHTFKSVAGYLGAARLRSLCIAIHNLARTNTAVSWLALQEQFERVLEETVQDLETQSHT